MQKVLNFITARLLEGSTWAGVAAGALAVEQALNNKAGLIAALIAGVAAMLIPDKGSSNGKSKPIPVV